MYTSYYIHIQYIYTHSYNINTNYLQFVLIVNRKKKQKKYSTKIY